jgi:hypothetical protein
MRAGGRVTKSLQPLAFKLHESLAIALKKQSLTIIANAAGRRLIDSPFTDTVFQPSLL